MNIANKGARCSVEGKKYEKKIYSIVKHCIIEEQLFNTQMENELGGCDSHNDLECNYNGTKNIPIEIKKKNTPDWMQSVIHYNKDTHKWFGSKNNKIPETSKQLFETLIKDNTLFNGNIPPFLYKNITHSEWIQLKQDTNDFNDTYIDCPNDTIKKLYSEKGCYYIQISDLGLYHLGNDICGFKVPEFLCEQQIRVRTKIHTKCDANGFCKLSVTIACKPKHIKSVVPSPYSLDTIDSLPEKLVYTNAI